MSYGDVADCVDNPVRGTLFNKPTPTGVAGYDVNRGCKPSYTGKDVTAANFLAVLKGDNKTTAEGKPVLRSTGDDRVFVYFTDHGAVGLVAMPVGKPLYAQDLMDALRYMWISDMYKGLVFYLEACESGSMFEGLLPTDANIYAVSASASHEPSYGTYCGDNSTVDGTVIGACLGDLFSVSWLENSDVPGYFHTESLDSQYNTIRNETDKSHVHKFGTASMGADPVEWFQGAMDFPSLQQTETQTETERRGKAEEVAEIPILRDAVNSRDIKLHTLYHQLDSATSARDQQRIENEIDEELAARLESGKVFWSIMRETAGRAPVPSLTGIFTKHSCLKAASTAVIAHCGPWNDFSLQYVRLLAELCQAGYSALRIADAAERTCAVVI
ncbi:unnamed protein product [Ascophyllum nodosum]